MNNKKYIILFPIAISLSVIVGLVVGYLFSDGKMSNDKDKKLNAILNLIDKEYVDSISIDDLIEQSIPSILENLDPHSSYISAKDFNIVDNELKSGFSGIGISFVMLNDTVNIVEIVSGGPSEKVGLIPGDKIIKVNDSSIVECKQEDVMKKLRGENGSTVKLGIKRNNTNKLLNYEVKRGYVPVNTIDSYYLIENNIGYIKINKFGEKTYSEFLSALLNLKQQKATKFIIDLRDNGGGYMGPAIAMANEFLYKGDPIVFTKGRGNKNSQGFLADGTGTFLNDQLAIIINEYSASASEILTGALQDNDRALIIGRRSFGKGLIQQQFPLNDGSAVRLTVGRYYTPSGRCIQKEYKKGNEDKYSLELYERYIHGELENSDSIKIKDTKIYLTRNGRKVYGGGGIIPDIFVPNDTSGVTSYYIKVFNKGLLQKFSFKYANMIRDNYSAIKEYNDVLKILPADDVLLSAFVSFAKQNDVPSQWYYINTSRQLIITQLKALIARDLLGNEAFYPIVNKEDKNISIALDALRNNKALYPITIEMQHKNEYSKK